MLFNSIPFLFFFVGVFIAYYFIVPDRYRWLLLLLASCYFYMAFIPQYILILFFLITLDFFLAKGIAASSGPHRKTMLTLSILANLGTLFFFKYFNFFNANVAHIAQAIHWNYSPLLLQIALPLGLSFHVFQSLSYVIEVYKGRQEPERHYGIYALYVMFFPQLVAGPIERPQQLLWQFHDSHPFSSPKVREGLELMLWGFFKKLVIADWIGQSVDHIYANAGASDGLTLLIAGIFFTYQIYCDFSGYSDIAVGSSLVFGYDLMQNFNRPFAARSIPEYWRRWHISLSSWLKDYLYYPLAFSGKRITKLRLYVSLVVTFVLIGLWHGANWTYVAFGLLHGIYMVGSQFTEKWRAAAARLTGLARLPRLHQAWQTVITFLMVTAALIFFRAPSLRLALMIFDKIGNGFAHLGKELGMLDHIVSASNLGLPLPRIALTLAFIVVLEILQYVRARRDVRSLFTGLPKWQRWAGYYALGFTILFLGYLHSQTFIYFQF